MNTERNPAKPGVTHLLRDGGEGDLGRALTSAGTEKPVRISPGRWVLDGLGSEGSWEIWTMIDDSHYGAEICRYEAKGLPVEQSHANGRLIAAAPRLLRCLRDLISNVESGSYESTGQCLEECRAVVAKALNHPSPARSAGLKPPPPQTSGEEGGT